jgi:carboxylate-amine ligase
MTVEFMPADPLGIGIELEFQLLDAKTLDLVDGILPLLELYPESSYVKPEFIQNTVEIATRVCYSLAELDSHVHSLVSELDARCRRLGMRLCGAGTHPFGKRLALITPQPRYRLMEKADAYLSHTQITFAEHVHIGMRSGEEAIRLMREIKAYLPLLMAVSASSPFWRGYDTRYVSYRQRILAASRSYGIPPSFSDWQAFTGFLDTTCRAGIFQTVRDIHWDIRPQPRLGTLEIRVMDMQPTVGEAIILAGLVRTLVTYLRNTPPWARPPGLPQPLPWYLEKHNHYQVSRLGLAAPVISTARGDLKPLRQVFRETIETLRTTAADLEQSACLEQLCQTVSQGVSYARQRAVYQATHSLRTVTAALVSELEHELAAGNGRMPCSSG